MIYLIDDNKNNQRLANYNISYVEDGFFNGYLISIDKLEKKERSSDIAHLKFLNGANCILLHSTTEDFDENKGFLPGSISNVIKIKEIISQEGDRIPLVLFSNSMGEAIFDFEINPNLISSIKKNLFYERLFDFLDFYKSSGKIEMRILAWGKNYTAKQVSLLASTLLRSVDLKNASDALKITDLSPILNSFKSFIQITITDISPEKVLEEIEDNPITILEYRKKINQIIVSFEKYGKNIHSWK